MFVFLCKMSYSLGVIGVLNNNLHMLKSKTAFSLAELSIVLIIIGLLVVGVTSGSKLVNQSKISNTISGLAEYSSIFTTFNSLYDAKPGDMKNANDYWGANCVTTSVCEGDGDDLIETGETFRLWKHLELAELISGNYTGIGGGTGNQADLGTNVPTIYAADVGVSIRDGSTLGAGNNILPVDSFLIVGGFRTNADTSGPGVTVLTAYNIDKKIDDGKPLIGVIKVAHGAGAVPFSCATDSGSVSSTTSSYVLTNTNKDCVFLYTKVFDSY